MLHKYVKFQLNTLQSSQDVKIQIFHLKKQVPNT